MLAKRKFLMTLKLSQSRVLDNVTCYLSGSMEYSNDFGTSWRKEFVEFCKKNNIKLNIIDPTNKPDGLMKEEAGKYSNLRSSENWKELADYIHQIRRDDLRCVDLSDFIVAHIDKNTHACGTYDEIFTAEDQHKPILCICKGGKKCLPGWLFDVLRIEEIFDTVEDCVNYLVKINDNKIKLDNRWVLIKKDQNEKF